MTHATIPAYVQGCERRSLQLGYTFDPFWLHDPKLKAESWIRILRTRGIKGIIIVGGYAANAQMSLAQRGIIIVGGRTAIR